MDTRRIGIGTSLDLWILLCVVYIPVYQGTGLINRQRVSYFSSIEHAFQFYIIQSVNYSSMGGTLAEYEWKQHFLFVVLLLDCSAVIVSRSAIQPSSDSFVVHPVDLQNL